MQRKTQHPYLGIIVMLGAIWGLSEAALGMHLKQCASHVSGSVMTGIALFFIAASWILSRRILGVVIVVSVASLMKLFDAFLLGLPVLHGAVANPVFAFITEGAAFVFIVMLLKERMKQRPAGQALSGGMAALLAANLFPLVKFTTGISACVVPGTGYPLSLYYIHFAILISLVTVPSGFWVGAKLKKFTTGTVSSVPLAGYIRLVSPVTSILCLLTAALLRPI